MHRAFSFPGTVERSQTKERLEASLVGLCELDLRKQRQEALVLGALALGEPPGAEAASFGGRRQEDVTLRRQLSARQGCPRGLVQALQQQVEELSMDEAEGCPGAAGEPGFDGWSESRSPPPAGPTETVSFWTGTRPRSVGEPLGGGREVPAVLGTLPRSFSAPYPPLENSAPDSWQLLTSSTAPDSWQLLTSSTAPHSWQLLTSSTAPDSWQWEQRPAEELLAEELYQQAVRVEDYILALIQRYPLASRLQTPLSTNSPRGSAHRSSPCFFSEELLLPPPPFLQAQPDLPTNPTNQKWGRDLLEEEACGEEAPSLEGDSYLALPCPQPSFQSLTGSPPSPLASTDPISRPFQPPPPQNGIHPQPQTLHHKPSLGSARSIGARGWRAPVHAPVHTPAHAPRPLHPPGSKPRSTKKNHSERQRTKKCGSRSSRCQSENSLLGQPLLPERRCSTAERHQSHPHPPADGGRRWCSTQELSQDEGEGLSAQAHRRQQRKARGGNPSTQDRAPHLHHQRLRPHIQERAPLCQEEDGYALPAPAESESSTSEVYSPASSSLSSDSDESGGLVWPQQLPPRLASTSSSSSPSPQTAAVAASQPKAFVKIKASHALKRKILRFRSGSLKVMTTV